MCIAYEMHARLKDGLLFNTAGGHSVQPCSLTSTIHEEGFKSDAVSHFLVYCKVTRI